MTKEDMKIVKQKRQERLKAQRKRILKQREIENERAALGHKRGEVAVGVDKLGRRTVSAESKWIGKWNRRRAKWDRKAR